MTATFRRMLPADRQFIVSTWSSSYRTSPHAGLLSMWSYADVMHREIGRIIDHPTTCTLVAEEPGEVDHIGRSFLYGFIATRTGDTPYVYYVYVKSPYREGKSKGMHLGYGAMLFAAAGVDPLRPFSYACRTAYCADLSRKIPLATFDTLPARYLQRTHEQPAADPVTSATATAEALRIAAARRAGR